MFVSLWLLITLGLLTLALFAALVYACRLVWRGNEYNKRLFVQVLEEREGRERLAQRLRAIQERGTRRVNGFSQSKQ